jgi:hypothetical protein
MLEQPEAGTSSEAWLAIASAAFVGPHETRELTLDAAGGQAAIAEVHFTSPQFTVALDEPWTLCVLPRGVAPSSSGAAGAWQGFLMPPGTGVVLDAGLWHSPVCAVRRTRVVVQFQDGTLARGSDVVDLEVQLRFDVASSL